MKILARLLDIIESAGIEVIKLPPRSPNLNSFMERFVRSVKDELLDRMNWR